MPSGARPLRQGALGVGNLPRGVRVVLDGREIERLLSGPMGPVSRDIMRRSRNVQKVARLFVRKRTRKLERSIVTRMVRLPDGLLAGYVGSDLPYAKMEHEGTRPHMIRARSAPRLVFYWPKAGRVVAFRYVNHPGTRGTHFLERALPAALR